MKSHWITHKGKQILYCDYSNFKIADFSAFKNELNQAVAVIVEQPEGTLLAITDVRGSVGSPQVVDALKEAALVTAKHMHKQAVVGVSGLKKVLFDAIIRISRQPAKAFGDTDLEEAKDWLAEKD